LWLLRIGKRLVPLLMQKCGYPDFQSSQTAGTLRSRTVKSIVLMPVQFVASCELPTQFGKFIMHGFEDPDTGQEHVALTFGSVANQSGVLCRVHSECLTGDCLFSMRCDCGSQLQTAMQRISEQGAGVLLYLRQEGRGIG